MFILSILSIVLFSALLVNFLVFVVSVGLESLEFQVEGESIQPSTVFD